MLSITKINLYSKKENAIVEWTVSREEQKDEGGNVHQVIMLRHKDEENPVSPHASDDDLRNAETKHKQKYGKI